MARLIVNAWVNGQGWGPDYGNAADVPPEVAAEIDDPDAWDQAPEVAASPYVTAQGMDPDSHAAFNAGLKALFAGTENPAPAPPPSDAGVVAAERALTEARQAEADAARDAEAVTPPAVALSPAEVLASIATDKPALLAFAADRSIEVDGRLGAARLHAVIEGALSGG